MEIAYSLLETISSQSKDSTVEYYPIGINNEFGINNLRYKITEGIPYGHITQITEGLSIDFSNPKLIKFSWDILGRNVSLVLKSLDGIELLRINLDGTYHVYRPPVEPTILTTLWDKFDERTF